MTVTAEINAGTHTGKRILRDLEKYPGVVSLTYPPLCDHTTAAGNTLEEACIKGQQLLNRHYEIKI